MGNYDDWLAHDRMDDQEFRMPRCATPGCEHRVTFDFDVFCSACHAEQERESADSHRERRRDRTAS